MNAPVTLAPELLIQLSAIVGENRIKTDAASLDARAGTIPSILNLTRQSSFFHPVQSRFSKSSSWPISLILRLPLQGRTGLSAGAVAANGEIVVSLDKMNRVLEFFRQTGWYGYRRVL